jgi:uncharacterized membrane protein YdjX (TVP38/TMEM64 family)
MALLTCIISHQQSDIPEDTMTSFITWLKTHRLKLLALLFWAGLVLLVRQMMQTQDISFAELTNQLGAVLTDTWFGPLLYIVAYLLRPLVLFPASLMTALAGNVFGLGWGFVIGLIAGTLSAGIPYAVGRWFSGDENPLADRDAASRLRRFADLLTDNPFQAVLTMRLLYLPYDAVSVLAGHLRIPFWKFALATATGNLGGTFAFVGLGASIEGDLASGQLSLNPGVLVFSLVVLIASLALSRYLNRKDKPEDAVPMNPVQDA